MALSISKSILISIVVIAIFVILIIVVKCGKTVSNDGDDIVYLDNNGTTKIFEQSLDLMDRTYRYYYGNASATYTLGSKSKKLLELCRNKICSVLNCEPCEMFFTSGATESNNIVIRGVFSKHKEKGKHVVTTAIEHPSVLETVKTLNGADITVLQVDRYGKVDLMEFNNSIRKDTILVAVIMGNNEIGTIQDISAMAAICNEKSVHLHVDMTQIVGKYQVDMTALGIQSATGSGHKFHGPKASGFLYLKKGTYFESCMSGGHQEKNIRSGTENIPGIVGMCYSLYICMILLRQGKALEMEQMRNWMQKELLSAIPQAILNGHPTDVMYNTLSLCVPVDSRKLLSLLDKHNICINTGSACSKGQSSKVLDAIGIPVEQQQGSLRISLGFLNTWEDCKKAVHYIIHYVHLIAAKETKHIRDDQ